jgi:hypothetical protein
LSSSFGIVLRLAPSSDAFFSDFRRSTRGLSTFPQRQTASYPSISGRCRAIPSSLVSPLPRSFAQAQSCEKVFTDRNRFRSASRSVDLSIPSPSTDRSFRYLRPFPHRHTVHSTIKGIAEFGPGAGSEKAEGDHWRRAGSAGCVDDWFVSPLSFLARWRNVAIWLLTVP